MSGADAQRAARREFSPSALAGEPPWLAMLGLSLADAHDGLLQCGDRRDRDPAHRGGHRALGPALAGPGLDARRATLLPGPHARTGGALRGQRSDLQDAGHRHSRHPLARDGDPARPAGQAADLLCTAGAQERAADDPAHPLGDQPDARARPGDRLRRRLRRSGAGRAGRHERAAHRRAAPSWSRRRRCGPSRPRRRRRAPRSRC